MPKIFDSAPWAVEADDSPTYEWIEVGSKAPREPAPVSEKAGACDFSTAPPRSQGDPSPRPAVLWRGEEEQWL